MGEILLVNFEETILRNILNNKEYRDKVFPFLLDEYFDNPSEKMLFGEIFKFIVDYKTPPSRESLALLIDDRGDLNEDQHASALKKIKTITTTANTEQNLEWLVDETEKYCQDRAIYRAVSESISILDGEDDARDKNIIPELLKDALAVGFDLSLGHDYINDSDARYAYYTKEHIHIPCDLYYINKITNGGVSPKTLNCGLADTNVGKSIFLCHLATSYLQTGHNVLYITMEMAEEELAKRIDANLMDVNVSNISKMEEGVFKAKMNMFKNKTTGNIKFKEFQSGSAHAGHIRQLINEYRMKEDFKIDILIVDYLSICGSERYKEGSVRHDLYLKYIAEELRNLGNQFNIPVWTVHQSNREGADNLEVGKKNVGDSYGVLQTVDLMFVLMTSDELEERNQILCKQLKSRYGPVDKPRTFLMGLDKSRMRFYDVESTSDTYIDDDVIEKAENLKDKMIKNSKKKKVANSGFRFE